MESILDACLKVIPILIFFVGIVLWLLNPDTSNVENSEYDRPFSDAELYASGYKRVFYQNGWRWEKDDK